MHCADATCPLAIDIQEVSSADTTVRKNLPMLIYYILILPLLLAFVSCEHFAARCRQPSAPARKKIYLWFDATANLERLSSRQGVARILDKCVDAGVDCVIVDVKPISGHVLYESKVAPRLTEWKGFAYPQDYDLLATVVDEGHQRNLEVFAAMNVFAEGHTQFKVGRVYSDRPHWQSYDYVIPEGETRARIAPTTEVTKNPAAFVSPVLPEVGDYELSILHEIVSNYSIDGVCLDRVRFSGLAADFSPAARSAFEEFIGHPVKQFPEEIYRIIPTPDGIKRNPGPLYSQWLFWRAKVIKDFFTEARRVVKNAKPKVIFADYVGSWYPLYYEEGVNWASPDFHPEKTYEWAPADYNQTAYAHLLDLLFSGLYYFDVEEQAPLQKNLPEWQSVIGAANITNRVVQSAVPIVGGLYVFQYQNHPDQFQKAMHAAYEHTQGLMLFDLVYLEDYEWWDLVRQNFGTPDRASRK
jgi:uncharacterized lipoprotein YddW (UPF0748 family)